GARVLAHRRHADAVSELDAPKRHRREERHPRKVRPRATARPLGASTTYLARSPVQKSAPEKNPFFSTIAAGNDAAVGSGLVTSIRILEPLGAPAGRCVRADTSHPTR